MMVHSNHTHDVETRDKIIRRARRDFGRSGKDELPTLSFLRRTNQKRNGGVTPAVFGNAYFSFWLEVGTCDATNWV